MLAVHFLLIVMQGERKVGNGACHSAIFKAGISVLQLPAFTIAIRFVSHLDWPVFWLWLFAWVGLIEKFSCEFPPVASSS